MYITAYTYNICISRYSLLYFVFLFSAGQIESHASVALIALYTNFTVSWINEILFLFLYFPSSSLILNCNTNVKLYKALLYIPLSDCDDGFGYGKQLGLTIECNWCTSCGSVVGGRPLQRKRTVRLNFFFAIHSYIIYLYIHYMSLHINASIDS